MKDKGLESIGVNEQASSRVCKSGGIAEGAGASGRYRVTCRDRHGNIKWQDHIENLVTTEGKNDALDKYLAGSAYTAAWYMGLISATGYTTGPAAGDTMASHGGWAEDQNYSEATRPAPSWNAASAGAKASNSVDLSINASITAKGVFLVSNNTKGGTTGILYSAGLFDGGDKALADGDTLQVTYTADLNA